MLEAKTKLTSVVCPFLLRQKLKSAQRSCIRTLQPLFEDHNCIPFLRWKPEPSQALETCLQHHNFPSIWWLFHLLSWSFLPPKTVSYFIPYKLQISPPVAGLWSKHSVKIVSKVTPMTSPGSLLIHCPALLNKIYSTYFKALEKRVSGSLVSRLCWTSNTSRGMCWYYPLPMRKWKHKETQKFQPPSLRSHSWKWELEGCHLDPCISTWLHLRIPGELEKYWVPFKGSDCTLVWGAAGCLGFLIFPPMILTCGKIWEPLISPNYLFHRWGNWPSK